jgi:hypothetical protein
LRGVPDPYDSAGGDPYHRWSHQMSVVAAADKLGSLVKGKLLGIVVTKHGVSPRIVEASVVGSRGRTSVTGSTLQSIFGLASTYASFTTISTSDPSGDLSATIYPAPSGAVVWVQARTHGAWHTIERESTEAGGSYSASVPGPGTYRVQFNHLNGPAVAAQ